MERIELLAPARDATTAIEAIRHGADAVYIGAPSHGARAAAVNTVADIKRVADYAHAFRARVYVTVNTIVYDDEIEAVEKLVWDLYRAGADALIVQDMGLLRMNLPPIPLHASTQCDTRDADKALMLEQAGFSQIVLARELSTAEIAEIHRCTSVPLEAFVHGALCVSYSGDCRASLLTTGRSANRGECAQICRYSFDLVDGNGRTLVKDKHLLSLRDMNRSDSLEAMIEAGVRSFKIEGRLKDPAYVKNVTAWYRRRLDEIIAASDGRYARSSAGMTEFMFSPDLNRSFNRGFTDYFATTGTAAKGLSLKGLRMASTDTPKSIGQPVGRVVSSGGRTLKLAPGAMPLSNGDGLGYFDRRGHFTGFRANKIEGNRVTSASDIDIPVGATIYRNSDKAFNDVLAKETARRTIAVKFTLRLARGMAVLDAECGRGLRVTATMALPSEPERARTSQIEARRRALEKTGGTIYRVEEVVDTAGDIFIPLSILSDLRRRAVELLDSANRATLPLEQRRPEDPSLRTPERLTFHDNVANRLARRFYTDHGTKKIEAAAEATAPSKRPDHAMTTRYCLRRELGRCLLTPEGKEWAEPLTLRSQSASFSVEFDCRACRMNLYRSKA